MDFPPDLPEIIEYRLQGAGKDGKPYIIVKIALPRTPVEYISSSGKTTAVYVTPAIPLGGDAWRRCTEKTWRSLKDIPKSWMPFIDRKRPGPMDPRHAAITIKVPSDAIRDDFGD